MRPHLIEGFRTGRNDNYTYAELLHLRVHGHDIPGHWLTHTKRDEDAAAEAQAEADGMAADLAAAEKARAKELAERDTRVLPQLNDMVEEVTELNTTANTDLDAAIQAVATWRKSAHAAAAKRSEITRLIRAEYLGEPRKDNNGTALPGQTYVHWKDGPIVAGNPVPVPRTIAKF